MSLVLFVFSPACSTEYPTCGLFLSTLHVCSTVVECPLHALFLSKSSFNLFFSVWCARQEEDAPGPCLCCHLCAWFSFFFFLNLYEPPSLSAHSPPVTSVHCRARPPRSKPHCYRPRAIGHPRATRRRMVRRLSRYPSCRNTSGDPQLATHAR